MTIVEVLANQVAMFLVRLARLVVHIDDDTLSVAYCYSTVHAFCPFIIFHIARFY